MKRVLASAFSLALAVMTSSCLQNKESEYEKQVNREDKIIADYIADKGIEAEQSAVGYYFTRDVEIEDGVKFNDEDIIGIYYEMETLDGSHIDSHTEEDGAPVLFRYSTGSQTLAPIAINSAVALAEVGETLTLYVPSYLAYSGYSYGQLFPAYTNMKITVTFQKIYPEQEVAAMEDAMIQGYIAENELEGFEKVEDGIYMRIVDEGDVTSDKTKNGNTVYFTYELFQLGEDEPFSKVSSSPLNTKLGDSENFDFINVGLRDIHEDAEVEVIAPSASAYGTTAQILPEAIREDYYEQGYLRVLVKPFTPVLFKATVEDVN